MKFWGSKVSPSHDYGTWMPDVALCDRVARPRDPDLDLDMDHMSIAAVCCVGDEMIVDLMGGHGRGRDTDDEPLIFDVAGGAEGVASAKLTGRLPEVNTEAFTMMLERFETWQEAGVLLHICSAPGRPSAVIASTHDWVPFPREISIRDVGAEAPPAS